MDSRQHIVWGAELSPFALKLESLLRAARVPFRRLPRDGSRFENLQTLSLIERHKYRRTILRHPASSPLDEYPLVPFLITPTKAVMYDSSALAGWLDEYHPSETGLLVPADPALRFVCRLIDEAFDEYGLYMVHHNRWKLAARDNDRPGRRLAREYVRHLPPGTGGIAAHWFARRQVRRLPYLFSIAPSGYRETGLPPSLTPPARDGFPPTHAMLESAWEAYVRACESLLRRQPFLLGERFTLADASAYGQLSMNLTDPAAAGRLRQLAPRTYDWLCEIRGGHHVGGGGDLRLQPELTELLGIVASTFVSLMRQNDAAYRTAIAAGETVFNENAFDRGRGLYDGELLTHPFRSVVKTFQVRVWRDLGTEWQCLDGSARARIEQLMDVTDLNAPPAEKQPAPAGSQVNS